MFDLNAVDPDIRRFLSEMQEAWKKHPPFETLSLSLIHISEPTRPY